MSATQPNTANSSAEDTVRAALETVGDTISVSHGQVIFSNGDPSDRLFIVQSGTVKLGHRAPDGREFLVGIFGPSDMFGELSIFDPAPRETTATAVTDVCVLTVDHPALRRCIAARPELAAHMLRVMAQRVKRANAMLVDLASADVASRVAKLLLQFTQRFGRREPRGIRVDHDLTQEEIAQLVGASREMVNRVLASFVDRGWLLLQGRSVVILDPARLVRRIG